MICRPTYLGGESERCCFRLATLSKVFLDIGVLEDGPNTSGGILSVLIFIGAKGGELNVFLVICLRLGLFPSLFSSGFRILSL